MLRKHLRDFLALVCVVVIGLGVAGYILSNQRFYLPDWVPVVGSDFVEVDAELSNAQAVVPGQGQTVNIAGVKVGEIGKVTLTDGHATVQMKIRRKYAPLYNDASILLRPKTGLKDMYLELDPGNAKAGRLAKGRSVPLARTLPDVNPDEFLAALDGDTQRLPARAPEQRRRGVRGRLPGRAARDAEAVRAHRPRHQAHHQPGVAAPAQREARDPQLPGAGHGPRRARPAAGHVRGRRQRQLRGDRVPGAEPARGAASCCPARCPRHATTLTDVDAMASQLGPALSKLRPGARALGPSLRETRPFLRTTTPVIRDQLRPFARDIRPAVRDLRRGRARSGRGGAAA